MKTFNSWKDISITWAAGKDRFMVRVGPLGLTPEKAFFKSKTDAVAFAQDSFNRWSNPDYTSEDSYDASMTLTALLKEYVDNAERPKQGKRSGGGYGTTGPSGLKLLPMILEKGGRWTGETP